MAGAKEAGVYHGTDEDTADGCTFQPLGTWSKARANTVPGKLTLSSWRSSPTTLARFEMGTGARRRFVSPSLRSTGRQRCAHRHRLATRTRWLASFPPPGREPLSAALLLAGLRLLDPETAHRLTIWGLAKGLAPAAPLAPDPRLKSHLFGLDFAHPVGLAAGFDKDAEFPTP